MQKNIVLLHGWGMNKAVWQLVNDALQSNPDLHVRAAQFTWLWWCELGTR